MTETFAALLWRMRRRLVIGLVAMALSAGAALAQPPAKDQRPTVPKAFTLTPDPGALVRIEGTIVSVDWTNPRAVMHLIDKASGQAWAVETGTPNTLLRAGLRRDAKGVAVEVIGFAETPRRCEPECKLLMRQLNLPDGFKVFLGSAGLLSSDTAEENEAALRATYAPTSPQTLPSPVPPYPGWRAFAAAFDGNAPVLLKGRVGNVDWAAPRVLIHMVEEGADRAWLVEGGSPELAAAIGMTRETLPPGVQIIVRGYRSKDKACTPECIAMARDVTFADGRKLELGVSPASSRQ